MLLDPLLWLDAVIAFALFILGGLTLIKNSHILQNRIFVIFTLASSCWIVSNYFSNDYSISSTQALIANRLTLLFPAVAMVSFLAFIWTLTHALRLRNFLPGLLLANAIAILATLTPWVASSVQKQNGVYAINFGAVAWFYFLTMFIDLVIAIAILVRGIRRAHSLEKLRLRAIAATALTVLLVNFATNAILPLFSNNFAYTNLGPLSTFVMVGGLFYSIAKYRLFDIRFFVVRAAAYLSTLFVMTFIFIAPFIALVSFILGRILQFGQFMLIMLLSVVLLYALQGLRRFFDRMTMRIFFRHYYDPQDVLDKLGDVLVRTADLRLLRADTAGVLQSALKPNMLRYILFTDSNKKDAQLAKQIDVYALANSLSIVEAEEISQKNNSLKEALRDEDIALAIKLRTTHEDMGYMVLGRKQSGELYSERDKRLLGVAVDEIAISLQNVLRFEEIQRFNVTLQEEVDSATRKLKRQNKRLEELDDIKDDFISMASHQLRTPLTSVKGYLSMVLEGDAGKLNPTQGQMLKQAFASSQRMVFLITDLLNVSRLKTGKFVIDAAPTNLKDVVEQELAQLHETAGAKNIKLAYEHPKTFPELMLDEVKIRQVVMNFVDNAIYYTPAGGRIRVELEEKPSTIELRVVDNGIGVPKEEQHHLFTKFYRATNARTARPDGTGLGLFMAQKVIIAQGGSVIFHSKEGQGSTFGFSFSKNRLAVKKSAPAPLAEEVKPEPTKAAEAK